MDPWVCTLIVADHERAEYESVDPPFLRMVRMTRDDFNALQRPSTITVHVRAGDLDAR